MTLRRSRGAGLDRETLDRLFLVIFPNLEVLGGQIANVVALLVGDDRVYKDQARLRFEDWRGTVAGLRRRLVLRLLWMGLRLLGMRHGRDGHEFPAHPPAGNNQGC